MRAMSEANKEVVRRYVEAFNRGDVDELQQNVFAPDAVVQGHIEELVAMEWFTLRDGKIVRRWGARDHASQMRQIGMPMA